MNTNNPFWLKTVLTSLLFFTTVLSQNNWFSMPSFWEVGGEGMAFNIEAFDMNKDSNFDVVVGNWNDTYVYFAGSMLDTFVDITYTGRMLAVCDYNGDGFGDLIAMHFTNYDSIRYDYDGEILFYWGSDTTGLAIDTIADYIIPLPTLYPTQERFAMGYFTVGIQKGDLNGDDKTDLVFNSTQNVVDSNFISIVSNGKFYIYLGREIPVDTADFVFIGSGKYNFIGDFVEVGNINGDSYDDLLYSSNQPRTIGSAYDSINYLHLFYGSENFSAIQGNESELYSSFVNPPDSTAGWFIRNFSVDDINADGIDDLVVGRSSYNYPHISTVHYGGTDGIDTLPSFTFIQDTTISFFFSAGGETQNIGDYNMDGYDDFIMSPAGYQQFALHFGGPEVSNNNRYGARGYSNGGDVFPRKGVNMGDQTNDAVNDIAVIGGGYVLMLYGQDIATTGINEESSLPHDFNLYQNFPNPFNPITKIKYAVGSRQYITLKVYDVLGNEIVTLVNEVQQAGEYEIEFNAEKYSLSSGVYFYKLKTEGGELSRKMILLK
ncbi:MAG TPA: T9SS type A sorting domain-containing protein [Ignavibacteriaceae bacterium]|nr:T9SS type A sorting domain-containing protein [Ignavibacteriaceae bacterium]